MNWLDRLWSKIERRDGDECWPWTGARWVNGYGKFWLNSHVRAHRAVWIATHGSLPEDTVIMHTCDNPICCNPAHLRSGTQADNWADMRDKKRHARHERHWSARLSSRQVKDIRTAVRQGATQKRVAGLYGVHPSTVSYIVRGKTWIG